MPKLTECELTPSQFKMMEIARVGFMTACPFFANFYYNTLKEVFTKNIPTAATDGVHVFLNPDYLGTLRVPEQVFVLAHETEHAVCRHPNRMRSYTGSKSLRGLPYDAELLNSCQDYIINKRLVDTGVGQCNPAWLYDPNISDDLAEDLYEKMYKKKPPGSCDNPGGKSNGQLQPDDDSRQTQGLQDDAGKPEPAADDNEVASTYGMHQRGGKPDLEAAKNQGRFDETLDVPVDPVTGREAGPSEAEHREAVARAAAVAKAMGKLPDRMQQLVDQICRPPVSWREHIRLWVTGRVKGRREDWSRPNRRRLALSRGEADKMIILPGRGRSGAGTVAVAIDSSGSIYADRRLLAAFFSELGAVVADCSPRRVVVIHCDAAIQRVDEVRDLAEAEGVRVRGTVGGGGTDFRPVFKYLAKEKIVPDCLVFCTDGEGIPPRTAPSYPVLWTLCKGGTKQPFGDHIYLEV